MRSVRYQAGSLSGTGGGGLDQVLYKQSRKQVCIFHWYGVKGLGSLSTVLLVEGLLRSLLLSVRRWIIRILRNG